MSKEHHIQQQLEAAQAQIQQLAQQLDAERDAACQIQAQLQGQIEQQRRYIAELEAQTTHLQWIINTSPATTYSCEAAPPYSLTYVSQNLETILGYTPEESKAEPDFWEQRLHPEDVPGVSAVLPTVLEQGKLQHDYRIRHRDGHYVWIRDALVLLRDTQGVPQQMVGFITDISEEKRLDADRQHTEQLVEQELQRIAEENHQFRQTLKAQEATYRHLFDCNPQPMWVYALESLRFLAVNDAAIAKYGYSRAEFLAMTIADIRPPQEVPRLLENVTQVDSGLDMAGVWQHCLRDGQIIQVEIVSYALEFEGRRAELVMAQDVTDRVRMEQALRNSEERYRLLAELAPQIVWSADMTGRHIYVSARMGEYVGLAIEQLMDFDWQAVIHPDDFERVRDRWMESLQTGMPYETEYRMRRADGEYRWHLSQAHRVQDDPEMQWLGMATDIHDRKQTELALQDLNQSLEQKAAERTAELLTSEAKLQAILNYSPSVIYVKDLEGRHTLVNQAYLDLFGCTEKEVVGKTNHEFFPDAIAEAIQANDERLFQRGEIQQFEETVRVNGEDRCFLSNKFLLRDEQGKVYALCGMSTDITDRKAMEVALQASYDRLQAMLAALPDHVFRVNREGRYLDFYPADATLEITGLDTLVGRTMTEVLPPEVAQAHLHRIEQALNTQIVQVSEQAVEANGTPLVREVRVAPCGPNEVLFVIRDITDRKQNEAQIKRQLAAIEAAIDGIAILQDKQYLYLNRAHLELFGYDQAEELLGQPWTVLYGPEERVRFEREIMPVLVRDRAWVGEATATRKDGTTFNERLSLTLTEDGLVICVCEDISDRKQIEAHNQQLLQELTGFKLALDESAIVSVTDAQGVIIDVNDKFCEISGYSRQELLGQTHRLVNSGYHSAYYFRDLWRTVSSGQVWHGEIRNRAKDGTRYWVDSTIVPFLDSEGQPERYLSIRFDVTDRKQAEIELRDLTSRLTLALQVGAYGTWTWDLADTLDWDEQMYQIFGLQDLDHPITYAEWMALVHPDDLASIYDQIPAVLNGENNLYAEFRIYRPDGELRWIQVTAQVQRNDQGNPVQMVGINRDMTHRKQAETALRQSEEELRLFINASSDVVYRMSADWREVQPLDGKDFVVSTDTPNQSWLETYIPPAEQPRVWAAIQNAIQTKSPFELEYQVIKQDGTLGWASSRAIPMLNEQGDIVEWFGTASDISDRKQAELDLQRTNHELARATRLKDEFLANMSHELRTPLNAILGMAEGLQEEVFGPLTDRQRRSLSTIERSGTHLLSLINDILDLSKVEAGQLELDFANVSVNLLCASSLTFVNQQAHQKRLHIDSRIPANLPDLYGDELRLRQVLVNLLSNAVKFTPEGGCITITASYAPLTPEAIANHREIIHPQGEPAATVGIVTLAVADTGIGISPENAQKLFQPFVQIDSALNRQHQGTGLGLALVKRITEMHGGKVELTSAVGSGSCFTLQLPIIPIPADNCSTTPPPTSIEAIDPLDSATAPLILLAEDNDANVSTITAYLTAKGYYLVVAKNGLEAINLAASTHPNLILMDIQMPQLDGLEAIRQIRQTPAQADVPIVALTALAMPDDRDRCLAAGANEYVSKPIRLKQLYHVIQTLLAKPSPD